MQPLDVAKLPRIPLDQKSKIDQVSSCPRPEHWDCRSVPFRWLEMVPADAWAAILQTCRAHSIVDMSTLLADFFGYFPFSLPIISIVFDEPDQKAYIYIIFIYI